MRLPALHAWWLAVRGSRRGWSALQFVLVAAACAGCAYVNPYVPLSIEGAPLPPAPTSMPRVGEALITIDAWRSNAESKQREVTMWNRGLNLATFGLAAGAAIAPIYNAYKDLTSALALGAATAYTGNSLFTPADQGQLYRAAVDALACIRQRGEGIFIAMSPEGSAGELQRQYDAFIGVRPASCQANPAFAQVAADYASAYMSMARVEGSDAAAGLKLRQAGQNVVLALNREIDSRAPSSLAILAAAKSLAPITAPVTAAPAGGTPRAFAPCTSQDVDLMTAQATYYKARRKSLDDALDELDKLNSLCELNPPTIADLAVSQDAATIVAGASVSIVVSGGRPPYSYVWDTTPPNTSIVLQRPTPDVFILEGVTTIKNGTYKFTIRDSGVSPRFKTVTVTAKASS